MSAPPRNAGYMALGGQCMCVDVRGGPRCPRPAVYIAQTQATVDSLWCAEHAAAIRKEHPLFVVSIRSWRQP